MLPLISLKQQEYLVSQSLRERDLSVWNQVQSHSSHTVVPEEVGGKWFDTSYSLMPCPSRAEGLVRVLQSNEGWELTLDSGG